MRNEPGDRWSSSAGADVYTAIARKPVALGPWNGGLHETGEHIARWDPARVLAECESKRLIVDLHQLIPADGGWQCFTCARVDESGWSIPAPSEGEACRTLALLALPQVPARVGARREPKNWGGRAAPAGNTGEGGG